MCQAGVKQTSGGQPSRLKEAKRICEGESGRLEPSGGRGGQADWRRSRRAPVEFRGVKPLVHLDYGNLESERGEDKEAADLRAKYTK
jgi:hypothetical protein